MRRIDLGKVDGQTATFIDRGKAGVVDSHDRIQIGKTTYAITDPKAQAALQKLGVKPLQLGASIKGLGDYTKHLKERTPEPAAGVPGSETIKTIQPISDEDYGKMGKPQKMEYLRELILQPGNHFSVSPYRGWVIVKTKEGKDFPLSSLTDGELSTFFKDVFSSMNPEDHSAYIIDWHLTKTYADPDHKMKRAQDRLKDESLDGQGRHKNDVYLSSILAHTLLAGGHFEVDFFEPLGEYKIYAYERSSPDYPLIIIPCSKRMPDVFADALKLASTLDFKNTKQLDDP